MAHGHAWAAQHSQQNMGDLGSQRLGGEGVLRLDARGVCVSDTHYSIECAV